MKKTQKNCLNCAFCTRNRNKLISYGIMSNKDPFWHAHCESLTKEEREELSAGNDTFIGKSKILYDNWIKNYNIKKEKYKKELKSQRKQEKETLKKMGILSPALELPDEIYDIGDWEHNLGVITGKSSCYDDYQKYGIKEPCPEDYDDEDYLSCWKQCWDENVNSNLVKQRQRLKQYTCSYFYNFNEKGNKTLELCNEELKEKIEKNRFLWTIWLTALTLLIALITLIATIMTNNIK